MKKNNRGFIQIILILIIVVAIAVGAYYFGTKNKSVSVNPIASAQPSVSPIAIADQTVGWKIYTNSTYKYSFKYPPGFTTRIIAPGAGPSVAKTDSGHFYLFDQSTSNEYIDRYLEIAISNVHIDYTSDWQKNDVKINDINWIKNSSVNPDLFDIYTAIIPNSSNEIELMLTKDKGKSNMANQILSTFKFTK